MSCWYEFSGSVKVHLTEESREALKVLESELEGTDFTLDLEEDGDVGTLEVSGADSMSYTRATSIDDALEALGPFAVEPGCFSGRCEDDESIVYVGSEEQVKSLKSKDRVEEIVSNLGALSAVDLDLVIFELTKRRAELICQRCGSPLTEPAGHCSDQSCPYSNHLQTETFTEG